MTVQVDLSGLNVDRMLYGKTGAVPRIMGGYASRVTLKARELAAQRVKTRSGAYLAGIHSTWNGETIELRADAPYSGFIEHGTRPHEIYGRPVGGRRRTLVFEVGGQTVFVAGSAQPVHHPGTKPQHVLRDAVREAGKELPK